MSPFFREVAIRVTKEMGLRYCGVDLLIEGDITKERQEYVVLEINAAPGVDNYARVGRLQERMVESMYLRILKAMKHL
jgi:glutathione synthase/RimK-type ligase-like ATP-grasp enzyme